MKAKAKKCKVCKKEFMPYRTTQNVCGMKCAIEYAKLKEEKKQAERKKLTEKMKWALETPNSYRKNKLQPVVNECIRIIDNGQQCICRPNELGQDAGHFISTGSNVTLSLNFHNIHLQSKNSNGYRGGESLKFYKGLKRIYGNNYAEFCDQLQQCEPLHLTKEEMKEARERLMKFRLYIRKTIIKPLKPSERLYYRNEANKVLDIYQKKYSIFL